MTSTPDGNQPDQSQPQPPQPPARETKPRPWRERRMPGPTNPDPTTPLEDVFLSIGRIVGAHGIRGEVKVDVWTDDPDRLPQLRRVYFNDDPAPRRLSGVRFHGRQALLTFSDVTDRNAADALRGTIVRIAGDQVRPPEEGEFFLYQLIGLSVFNEAGMPLGTLTEVLQSGEVDIYVVRDAHDREQLFPALKEIVLEIDPAANRVVVRPPIWDEA